MYSLINDFEDLFFNDFSPVTKRFSRDVMKTDIYEKDGQYHLDVEVPGYKKDEINLELLDGYLTITASHTIAKEENDERGKVIRKERDLNACSRSFKIGTNISACDVKATFENGVLHIELPSEKQKALEKKETVQID